MLNVVEGTTNQLCFAFFVIGCSFHYIHQSQVFWQSDGIAKSSKLFSDENTCPYVRTDDAYPRYLDAIVNNVKNEVACDYNAGFQSAVAGLRTLATC